MSLNNLFDKRKDILKQLADYAAKNSGFLPDHVFSQACSELDKDEDQIMDCMYEDDHYTFTRDQERNGWDVKEGDA